MEGVENPDADTSTAAVQSSLIVDIVMIYRYLQLLLLSVLFCEQDCMRRKQQRAKGQALRLLGEGGKKRMLRLVLGQDSRRLIVVSKLCGLLFCRLIVLICLAEPKKYNLYLHRSLRPQAVSDFIRVW